jgi:hypothetical protein
MGKSSGYIKRVRINVADNMIEIGRLTFAGLVIGGLLSSDPNWVVWLICGSVCSASMLVWGIILKSKYDKK